jgi:hypothetical protein
MARTEAQATHQSSLPVSPVLRPPSLPPSSCSSVTETASHAPPVAGVSHKFFRSQAVLSPTGLSCLERRKLPGAGFPEPLMLQSLQRTGDSLSRGFPAVHRSCQVPTGGLLPFEAMGRPDHILLKAQGSSPRKLGLG